MRVVAALAHDLTDASGLGQRETTEENRCMRIELSNPRRTVELMSYLKHYGWSLRLLDLATIDAEAAGGVLTTTHGKRELTAHVKAWEAFYAGEQARVLHDGPRADNRAPKALAA